MSNPTKYFIIGPRKHWEVRRQTFFYLGSSLCVLFLILISFSVSQFFYYYDSLKTLKASHSSQQSKARDLQNALDALNAQILDAHTELKEKEASLHQLKNVNQKRERKSITQYQENLNQLKKELQNKIEKINELAQRQKGYQQTIHQLSEKFEQLEKEYQNTQSKENQSNRVMIDDFQISSSEKTISTQFNLRNNTQELQKGYISVVSLKKDHLAQKMAFHEVPTSSFQIRRFRPFSMDFPKELKDRDVIRIIVWDRNKTQLLDHNYPLSLNQ